MTELNPQLIESMLFRRAEVKRIYLAYSGGVDSHVLLHLCQRVSEVRDNLIAVHVCHGLQTVAKAWPQHCQEVAEQLGISFLALPVDAQAQKGESPEEAARNARYQALAALLEPGDIVLVAQHREDQLETMLLQLFRGAGLSGLSAMPEAITLGKGHLLRPLLQVSKQAIDDYAQAHRLRWVEDPSNGSNDFDRNFLRNQVLPLLKQRWPALDKTATRAAGHCAQARQFIEQTAEVLLEQVLQPDTNTLSMAGLLALDPYRQQLTIRQWFHHLGLKMPSQAIVQRILCEVIGASENADPILYYQGYMLRRYRQRLFCLSQTVVKQVCHNSVLTWNEARLNLPDGRCLHYADADAGIDAKVWRSAVISVRFRSGGEKIGLPGRQGRHALKQLYQDAGIPPWERPSIPLIYLNGRLAAVADLWISREFYTEKKDSCIQLLCDRQK